MYLGLDCSTFAVHGAIVDTAENLISLHKWSSKQKNFEGRFPEILLGFSEDLSKIKVTVEIEFAALEAAIFIQNPKTTIAIAHVVGAAWLGLLDLGIPSILIDNRRWKKIILGKGNASKIDIKNFAIDKWGERFPEQDYADAACIALWNKRRSDNG